MKETIDPILELDESTIVGEVANRTLDNRPDREFFRHEIPGVLLNLLHAKRDLLLLLLDLEDYHLGLISDRDHLVGMVDALGPGHLGNVNQSLDAGLELDKGSIREHVHHSSLHPAADRIFLFDIGPRTLFLLLEPERDTLFFLIHLENLYLDLLIDLYKIGRVADSSPAHISDMEQAIESAEIDKGAKLGDVLDHTLADLAELDAFEQFLLLGFTLLFDKPAPGNDDVHASFINLDDLAAHFLADVFGDVPGPANSNLRCRQENRHTDVYKEPTLDLACHLARDLITLIMSGNNTFPTTLAVSLSLGKRYQPVFIFN